ncbi:uncharacterized protein [Physcomitrium patens]|uniref:LysM domain-containing protein n=2 Tax=Physcomitrium patens TaxID=3218 RepID=A0A7I4D542_PHYPA|nr:uncharacterized protein LOC112295297 isoform X1 [Physcomitrium patens]|eukprot:XP_024402436.1 uncharacterized protein LOC112295297 isoform X1 [Physcomitrella patens]
MNSTRMAANSAKSARPVEGRKGAKDESIAKAAGVVVASGIAWSLFRSITSRGEQQNNGDTLSKEVKLNAGDAALGVSSTRGTSDPAGRKISNFGYKAAGKTVQVHDGDTLWGLAMKHNVSVDALIAINGIKDGDSIIVGDTIILPKALKP